MPGSEKSGAGEPMASGGGWSTGEAGAPAWSDMAASAAAAALRAADRRLIRNILLSFRADRSVCRRSYTPEASMDRVVGRASVLRVGLISDTHGLLRPEAT